MVERIKLNNNKKFIEEKIIESSAKYIQFTYDETTFEISKTLDGDIICLVDQYFEDSKINRYINCYSIQNRLYSIDLIKNMDFEGSLTRSLNKIFLETEEINIMENLFFHQVESNSYFEEAMEVLDLFDFKDGVNETSKFKQAILPERIFSEEKYQKYLLLSVEINDKEKNV